MHELSIAVDLVEICATEAERLGGVRIDAVRVRLGPLSGVVQESLLFCFDVAAAGTVIEGARLEIETEGVLVFCTACQDHRTLIDVQHRRCPVCNALCPEIISGDRLELIALSVVDHATPHC
jgi:hydrogenase nickel incorporation protein HypA/HybF